MNPSTICLCMMVRNEATVIQRALLSVLPIIDYWVVCDTGSDDTTMSIISQTLQNVPGELHQVPWINFGKNRTQLMHLAHGKADYLLIMDADMIANVHQSFKHTLYADAYEIRYEGNESYTQRMLVAGKHRWNFIGVTHEYIHSPTLNTVDWLDALTLTHLADGGMRKEKFERDLLLLTNALGEEPENDRYIFYLAQTYKDLGRYADALLWYEKRAAMQNTWDEEQWFAQMQAGRMKLFCNYDWNDTWQTLMQAFSMRPTRLEPLYLIVSELRYRQLYLQGYILSAFIANGFAFPARDILFIDKPVYEYLLLLEHAVCAYGIGRFEEALNGFNKILMQQGLPPDVHASTIRGRALAMQEVAPPVLSRITSELSTLKKAIL